MEESVTGKVGEPQGREHGGFFSSARVFSLQLGEFIEVGGVRGYYIDLRMKAQDPGWAPAWVRPGEEYVDTCQWGLGSYERYLAGHGRRWLEEAVACGEYLLANQERNGPSVGGWRHSKPFPHTFPLRPGWVSAMAQGQGASLFVRLHDETEEDRFADAALRALLPLRVPSAEGGASAELHGHPFPEEYPTTPPSFVLNGGIFALWGLYDVWRGLGDDEAGRSLEGRHRRARPEPPPLGRGVLVALRPLPASDHEHRELVVPRPPHQPAEGARPDRAETRVCRDALPLRGLSGLAELPGAGVRGQGGVPPRRPAKGGPRASPSLERETSRLTDVLVLCYHAVSETWPAPLSVTPDSLTQQVEALLERGYVSAAFTSAVLDPPAPRTLAITFDDGFRSVVELALPILARLGVQATLFVPTEQVGADRLLTWPGIDGWLGGPFEQELMSVSWDDARRLASSGWEIGSHTCTHPRLTTLGAGELAGQLARSRERLEDELGRPCTSVAYPYGDVDARVARAAQDAGYAAGAALPSRFQAGARFEWPRVGVYHDDGMRAFSLKTAVGTRRLRASAAWPVVERVGRAARRGAHLRTSVRQR